MIQQFKGFHGFAMVVQIHGIQYFILAETTEDLQVIHSQLNPTEEFRPLSCRDAILINAALLPAKPDSSDRSEPSDQSDSTTH